MTPLQIEYGESLARDLDARGEVYSATTVRWLIAERAQLRSALAGLMRNACRPGDDGKFDDLFDDARNAARIALRQSGESP